MAVELAERKVGLSTFLVLALVLIASCGEGIGPVPTDYDTPVAPSPVPSPTPEPMPPSPPVPQSCSDAVYKVSPTRVFSGYEGGECVLIVTAPTGCAWTAESSVNWVEVARGNAGAGNGTVMVRIAPYLAGVLPRAGTLLVAKQFVRVEQVIIPAIGVDCRS